jgi:hypothetical protein
MDVNVKHRPSDSPSAEKPEVEETDRAVAEARKDPKARGLFRITEGQRASLRQLIGHPPR